MQNIPRNELLDKLAAGWKVRRKDWPDGWGRQIGKSQSDATIPISHLIAEDWEGQPSEPWRLYEGCDFIFALQKLFAGANKIRRTAWHDKDKGYTQGTFSISLQVEELLAQDWEVWGHE